MRRPTSRGGHASTPAAANLIDLLGGMRSHAVAISTDEHMHLARLYGYTEEPPNEKPPPPEPPRREDFKTSWDYECAVTQHKTALKLHETWEDPRPFHQAGADRNMMREAGGDGLDAVTGAAGGERAVSRIKCNNCEERRDVDDTFLVSRKVGGNYRQAARWQKCRVCSACVQRLAASITPGHLSVDRWSKAGIEIAAARIAARRPWDSCRVWFKIDDESRLADGKGAWKRPPAFLDHWRVVDVVEVNGRIAAVFHVTGSADIRAGYNIRVWLEKIGARKVARS